MPDLPRLLTPEDLHTALKHSHFITRKRDFIVIGSGSTLASLNAVGKLPDALLISRDIDLFPADRKLTKEDLLEIGLEIYEKLGPESVFAKENGFFVEGVQRWMLDYAFDHWEDRLVVIEHNGVTGKCLSPIDLAVVKLGVGRPKDVTYVAWQIKSRLVPLEALHAAIQNHFSKHYTEDDRLNRKTLESRLAKSLQQSESMVWEVKV